ncbi:hypothetical protein GlitD10_1309 [Gloeomargarita lithophora Alchichica-D10]|uniref:Uncharacterized protein n=1 Tax=Gloeomargarita lithophora Alchichica-D10 TaxID=1188229 RepID=A0A1J0ACG6_9CYAN|nr:hypothetical protein [Gloeomargarita lithophora]APB33630.1 hypothetical protein GlitD10_1309 [Gloeomargarita lithophora Alchichica-D10]
MVQVPESIGFEQAIDQTQTLISSHVNQEITPQQFAQGVQKLVQSENGARGFFVTYLTLEHELADQPDQFLVNTLQNSPEIVSELLVKNLVMSTAMAITHRRNQDEVMAQGSDRVQRRTQGLIQLLNLPAITTKAQELYRNAAGTAGVYSEFLDRWGYDAEQKQAMQGVLQPWIGH